MIERIKIISTNTTKTIKQQNNTIIKNRITKTKGSGNLRKGKSQTKKKIRITRIRKIMVREMGGK